MASLNIHKPHLPPQGGLPPRAFEPSNTLRTHEGAPAATISAEQALRRSVCSCLLWENEFYEDGKQIADRIADLARQVPPRVLADLAVDARSHMNVRHVPLPLLAVLAQTGRGSRLVGDTIGETIQRADELSEFLAVYARINQVEPGKLKAKLSAQVKRGLARAFTKFDQYQLSKYDRANPVRLRDALFLCHARPKDDEQAALWKHLIDGTLPSPDTWEVNLSGGADKRETWERLLADGKMGYMAVLRNLRNMEQAGVPRELVTAAVIARKGVRRVLPFRYVAAARACPAMVDALGTALDAAITDLPVLPGKTAVLVDVSGSMDAKLSARSDLTRMDSAAALAALLHGDRDVYTFSNHIVAVPEAAGLRGIDAIVRSQPHQGTALGGAVSYLNGMRYDRLIVITDEQSRSYVPEPMATRAYLINVASAQHGVGYGERWTHIDGFSEQVIRWIHEFEAL